MGGAVSVRVGMLVGAWVEVAGAGGVMLAAVEVAAQQVGSAAVDVPVGAGWTAQAASNPARMSKIKGDERITPHFTRETPPRGLVARPVGF